MKNTVIFLFLLTLASFVNAQIIVTGKVIDNTNEPIEFANVILLDKEYSNIIIGTITDKNGTFAMTTDQKGKFNLQISFVGFEDYKTNINKSIDLGTVTLKSSNELDEVVITARKNIIERKADKGSSEIDIFENNVLLDNGFTTNPRNRNTKYINTSINYSVKIDTLGGKLSFIGDYATQSFENAFDATTTYEQNYYYDILERSKTNASTDIMSAQVDFNKTINKIGDLSSGIKITTTNRDNKTIGEHFVNGDYQIADDRTNAYDFTENIYAAYFSVSRKIFNDINLKLGLRVENTTIEGINLLNNAPASQN